MLPTSGLTCLLMSAVLEEAGEQQDLKSLLFLFFLSWKSFQLGS